MSETVAGSPYTPPLPPRLPLRLVYTQKYLNVFECTQPYFVLIQETLNFFSLLSRGPRPLRPPLWLRPCALVSLFHHVTRLLESNDDVRCLCIDFSKAFDIADHGVLAQKLAGFGLPEQIYMWILSFLSDRSQQVKWTGAISCPLVDPLIWELSKVQASDRCYMLSSQLISRLAHL